MGTNPGDFRINPNTNRVYVINRVSDNVSIIDGATTTDSVIATVTVGNDPRVIRLSTALDRVYVLNRPDGTISIIDGATTTDGVIATVTVGVTPMTILVDPATNRVYVSNRDMNTVSVIDGTTTTDTLFGTITVGPGPNAMRLNSATNRAYVANQGGNTVSVIDTTSSTLVTDITVCNGPQAIRVNSTTNRIYVTCPGLGEEAITVIDGENNAVIDTIPLESGTAPEVRRAADTGLDRVYISNAGASSITVIGEGLPDCTLTLNPSYDSGIQTLNVDVTVGTSVAVTVDLWGVAQGEVMEIIDNQPLGITEPPIDTSVSLSNVPAVGIAAVFATLTTPELGIICSDFKTVDTGSPP